MSDLFLPLYQYLNWQNLEYANNRQTQLQSRLNCLAWNICTRVLILRDLWNLSVVRPKAYTSFYWVNKFTSKSNTYFPNKLTIYSYTFFLQHKELTFRVFLYQILFYFCFVLLLTVDVAKCNVIKSKKSAKLQIHHQQQHGTFSINTNRCILSGRIVIVPY